MLLRFCWFPGLLLSWGITDDNQSSSKLSVVQGEVAGGIFVSCSVIINCDD